MRRLASRGRSGITLTEILISIMIMGIGLVSLATLFPLGLLRLRTASRDSRSTLEAESAFGEISSRNLFGQESFTYSWYSSPISYDPWTSDPYLPNPSGVVGVSSSFGIPGLPVAYDPLFWSNVDYSSGTNPKSTVARDQARLGSGVGFLRPDPGGGAPSAYGLQRITNFLPAQPNGVDDNGIGGVDDNFELNWPFTYPTSSLPNATDVAGEVFASPDDPVFQKSGAPDRDAGAGSPLVPDMSVGVTKATPFGTVMRDYAYSWMFTGQQASAGEFSTLDGSIVVFNNRPFGLDPATTLPFSNPVVTQTMVPTGERVVEAAWGWSTNVPTGASVGYSLGDDRVVLLRWPASVPDPTVKAGNWIADVTYERIAANVPTRFYPANLAAYYPAQRCYWYRVVKHGDVQADPGFNGDPNGVAYRRMLVTLDSPVRAKTLLDADGTGSPTHVNAALIAPSVVNVFPKVFYSR
jgi:hypothetical protein